MSLHGGGHAAAETNAGLMVRAASKRRVVRYLLLHESGLLRVALLEEGALASVFRDEMGRV